MPGTPAAPLHSTRPFPPQRQGRTKSTRRTRAQRRVRGRSRGTSRPEGRTTARRFPHGHSRDRAFVLGHVFIWTRTCKGTLGVRPSGPLLASEGAVQRILTGDHSSDEEIQKRTWKELRGRSSESGPLRPVTPPLERAPREQVLKASRRREHGPPPSASVPAEPSGFTSGPGSPHLPRTPGG